MPAITPIPVRDLLPFAERVISTAQPGQFIPITMQRARAHAHNPYAAKDDIALLVATDDDGEIVGYFGILPLLLRDGGDYHKVHWFTTWNVSAKVRGQGVGSQLMQAALDLGQDYLIVGSVYARRVCRKFGFAERTLDYFWLDRTGMSSLNPLVWGRRAYRKSLHLAGIKKGVEIHTPLTESFAKRMSPLARGWFAPRLERIESELAAGFRFQEVSQIRGEPPTPAHRPQVELHRGVDAVNWMLAYPWVVARGQSVTEGMDYYFSDSRPLYRQIAVEIFDRANAYLGFAVFSVTSKGGGVFVQTRDFLLTERAHERAVLALALRYAREHDADTIELPAEIAAYLPPKLARPLLQRKTRTYQAHPKSGDSPLARLWPEITFHLYDGDMAFS
jgi:GNAT superfamily N-acetyltransferase